MDRIAIISDVHGNITALKTVLADISSRGITRIFCLGDSVTKCANPDLVIDLLKDTCEVMIKGNCDDVIASPSNFVKKFWSREKIGEERANYLYNLPIFHKFFISGRFIRLFHASPYSLSHIYNPMFSNENNERSSTELKSCMDLFANTSFLGKTQSDPIPDIIGYGHIHTPNILRYGNKTIFNPGSVGMPVEMMNNGLYDETNRFSTVASYIILEGTFGSKELAPFSINLVRLPYDIQKELEYLENSDMPNKNKIISSLKTACS